MGATVTTEVIKSRDLTASNSVLTAGGRDFHAIPCLNERNDWIHALADVTLSNLLGWTDTATHESLEKARLRALAMGARS